MMYGQLSSCDSLREVICIIDAIKNKSYHLGFGSGDIKLSNVAYANANRDYRIFEEFAYYIINLAQSKKKYPGTLRRIVYYAPELKRTFTFLTNNFVLKASDIALLYKQRW